ncbi:SET domain-containing protein 5 [Paraphoma chrysanthemicola]|uniref:SET domain-containing protein 5 n=1 Tax=Paraphoma chrysanthemicola TaxID=798071 RepID=A0A8K0VST3_9PLEO|nr:SET domain-containing protein 5 [Paraphoma chrysanthemicola]
MPHINGSSLYALQDIPGKGKGLVATENIPKGTRILSEQPVVTTPQRHRDEEWLKIHISEQVERLSEQQRHSFLTMYNIYPYKTVAEQSLGIIRTIGLPIEDGDIEGGVFLEACRINHACDNNAQKHWNQAIKRHTVHALRDISKGEEITIYYLGLDSGRAIRQKKLQEKFQFLCACRLCSLPPEESEESDRRLKRIDELDDLIGRDGMRLTFLLRTLRYADERVRLYNGQGPDNAGLPRAYLDAAQIAIANGDLARGRIFAERAVEGRRTAQGSDSKEAIEYDALARNPSKLPLYRLSTKWQTSLDEVPQSLDTSDFEDWLWKREKAKQVKTLAQFADLRDREMFPSFAALPASDGDLDFYGEVDGSYQPLHRWCFLGEITNSMTLHHLELELMDVDNNTIPLHFYTDDRGREMTPVQIQNGYTVAVPYAKRRVFTYGDPGIRHEDPKMLKVRLANP